MSGEAMGEAHYRFPPARAYRLNRCLYTLKSDDSFRERYAADPAGALSGLDLEEDDRRALVARDRDTLVARGAHPYLVFMVDLRLRMDAGTMTFENF